MLRAFNVTLGRLEKDYINLVASLADVSPNEVKMQLKGGFITFRVPVVL